MEDVFASLSNMTLALKPFDQDHAGLLGCDGAAATRYQPDEPASTSHVVVPIHAGGLAQVAEPDHTRRGRLGGQAEPPSFISPRS